MFDKEILYLLPQKELKPPKKSSLEYILKKYMPRDIILIKENIFNFNNISEYLQTWYRNNKNKFPRLFNYRILAKELGCKSTSELVRVIKYKKSPSRMMVDRFIKLMHLSPEEAIYMIILSHYSDVNDGNKQKEIVDRYNEMLPEND